MRQPLGAQDFLFNRFRVALRKPHSSFGCPAASLLSTAGFSVCAVSRLQMMTTTCASTGGTRPPTLTAGSGTRCVADAVCALLFYLGLRTDILMSDVDKAWLLADLVFGILDVS